MIFYDLTVDEVKNLGELCGDSYKLDLGMLVEATVTKRNHLNKVLADSLSVSRTEDNFMVKYQPSNTVLFDKDLIENSADFNEVSCQVDKNNFTVHIGRFEKYPIKQGVLALSGILSANGYVMQERYIYTNNQMSNNLSDFVRILALGVKGDDLLGLYMIKRARGIAINSENSNRIVSLKTFKYRDDKDWEKHGVSDWFNDCQIVIKTNAVEEKSEESKYNEQVMNLLQMLGIGVD